MTDILEGVRVIEMGHVVCVPAATSMMGDCGADVIKIEPLTGDQSRTFRGTEINPGFYLHNRSKRSIAIDLRQQAGKDIVYKMVGDHDVFLTNYQAGSLQRLGLDYETLCGIKANIIYGIVSAYGTVGPDKDMAGYDFAAGWARSGIQDMLSVPGTPPPASRPGIIDRVSSMQVFGGICAALYHREHTGEGQKVEFNLYHTGVWMVGADIMDALFGLPLRRVDPKSDNPFYDVYKCKDGRWLQLTAADRYAKAHDPVGAKFWQSFCRALDRPDLADDPRFATTDMRQQHRDVLHADAQRGLQDAHLRGVGGAPARREPDVRPDPLARAGHRGPAGAGQRLLRGGRPARRRHVPHHQLAQQVRPEPGVDQVDHAGARRADGRDPRRARLQHERHR